MSKVDYIGKIIKYIPRKEFSGGSGEKVISFFDKKISVPENRLIIGMTALLTQPVIDLYNKDVDEKTRKISCARTIAKIISGTAIGVGLRYGCIKLAKNYSKLPKESASKMQKLFTPSEAKTKDHAYMQYQNTMGALLSVVGLVFANFLIDAPLTTVLTNSFMKKIKGGNDDKS